MTSSFAAIILAAGHGKRMKSSLPKVLHQLAGVPLIHYPLEICDQLKIAEKVLVVQKDHILIKEKTQNFKPKFAVQNPPRGTGDALKCGLTQISKNIKHTLVLCGDMPLLTRKTISKLIKNQTQKKAAITFLTTQLNDPASYGRVVRNIKDQVEKIVEFKDASHIEKKINEINMGIYCFSNDFLKNNLGKLKANNAQKEYYITDLIEIALKQNLKVEAICIEDSDEGLGVNTISQLDEALHIKQQRTKNHLREKGVKLIQPNSIHIDHEVEIGSGSIIYGPNYILGKTKIGKDNVIEPYSFIQNSNIGNENHIKANCYINQANIKSKTNIGPSAHLRPGTELEDETKVGNFVEIKKAKLGKGSKANHLSYVGDATIGKKVNIGAGFITCNYDGKNKYQTIIKDEVFIGSDTQIVAPVTIGKGAFIGAGSTITKDVESKSLALTRAKQISKKNWKK